MFDREAYEAAVHQRFPMSDHHPMMPRHRKAIRALGESGLFADTSSSSIEEFTDYFHTLSGQALERIINNPPYAC